MTPELRRLTLRLDRAERRARVSAALAFLAVGLTLLLNVRPAALAQTPGVSLAALVSSINSLTTRLTADEATISANSGNLGTLTKRQIVDEGHITGLMAVTAPITMTGTDLYFTGVNVHIVSGSGSTSDGTVDASGNPIAGTTLTGLGNLIIGYDAGGTGGGSHNLVLGDQNRYLSFGGLVAGESNTVSGHYATVTGGSGSTASGITASVSGGDDNHAEADFSSVSGGTSNYATGVAASLSGGIGSQARGDYASVSGGFQNFASGTCSSVSGGSGNTASGGYDFLGSGGYIGSGPDVPRARPGRFCAEKTLSAPSPKARL